MKKPLIGIVMGSDSDLMVMKDAASLLDTFNVPYELSVVSAHRTPSRAVSYASNAVKRGIKVIIAGAGGAAHLPGVLAAFTLLPVIGVPIKAKSLEGIDSLLSMVQMPGGVPVATVGINNAQNAALLAIQIIGIHDKTLFQKLKKYRASLESAVIRKAKKLEALGYTKYLP